MLIQIKNVSVENVVKGRSRYSIAHVTYDFKGEEKTRKIMSFSNPDVFKKVQECVGQTVEITTGKNDAGYDEWKSITAGSAGGGGGNAQPAAANTTRVSGSNYETKEERAARQVLIVKQSSLNAAVATLTPGAKAALDPKDVLRQAQEYTDWVFGKDQEGSIESMSDDLNF